MNTNKFKCIILLISILLTSCNSTKVLSSWSIQNPSIDVMNKVLVLAVMTDRIAKEQTEQTMVSQLKESGLNAYTAMSILGPKGFSGLTDKEITDKLKGSDFTSILIISLLDKEKEKSYTTGTRYSSANIVGYSRYYRRYLVVYDHIYTPGYYTTNTSYMLEADIYTINDQNQLIYSAQTRSYDPNNAKDLANSFSKSIISELKEKGFIPYIISNK